MDVKFPFIFLSVRLGLSCPNRRAKKRTSSRRVAGPIPMIHNAHLSARRLYKHNHVDVDHRPPIRDTSTCCLYSHLARRCHHPSSVICQIIHHPSSIIHHDDVTSWDMELASFTMKQNTTRCCREDGIIARSETSRIKATKNRAVLIDKF